MNTSRKTTNQREEEILRELQRVGGSGRVSYLAAQLGVSNETIRRNIRTLEDAQIVRKVHGGVHLVEEVNEAPFQSRMGTQAESKEHLAAAVAENIGDGDSVFLDIGSTTAYVAMALNPHSPPHAAGLARVRHPGTVPGSIVLPEGRCLRRVWPI